ncbi:hypothetical protein EON83_03625 [bacterium]|nr:MAG: hypothetical protein EON83_03625 [bacterium]
MKFFPVLLSALFASALPALAQPEEKPINGLPYPVIAPEEAARLIALKTIKLHFRDVTVKEALDEVMNQTGQTIDTQFGGDAILAKKLSLDIETQSFREATNAIFEEAGVDGYLQKFGQNNRWLVSQGKNPDQNLDAPLSGQAPFQLRLLGLNSTLSKSVRLGKTVSRSQDTTLNTNLKIEADPQIPLVGAPRIEITRAEDDKGRSLLDRGMMPFFDGDPNFQPPLVLRGPATDTRVLSHLEGKVTYILATKQEKWEVPDVLQANGVSHNFQIGNNQVNIAVKNAQKTLDSVQLEITATAATPIGARFGRTQHPLMQFNQLSSSIVLLDANGKVLGGGGYNGSGGGNQLTLQLRYFLPRTVVTPGAGGAIIPAPAALAEPLKLVINAPSDIVQTQVPFSFSDVPLP